MVPTGVGILYGKEEWLNKLPPYQGGGEMIKEVTFEKTTYADLPHKFEAGHTKYLWRYRFWRCFRLCEFYRV